MVSLDEDALLWYQWEHRRRPMEFALNPMARLLPPSNEVLGKPRTTGLARFLNLTHHPPTPSQLPPITLKQPLHSFKHILHR